MTGALAVEWIDRGREPEWPPDPRFPKGIDIDGAFGMAHSCETQLPYPAKRCGVYVVTCTMCGARVGVTTAGRPDDPRSIKVGCKTMGRA